MDVPRRAVVQHRPPVGDLAEADELAELMRQRARAVLLEPRAGGFSAEAPGALSGDSDLYVSESHGGVFRAAGSCRVPTAPPRSGSRTSVATLELFFFSTRPGTLGPADLYSATRDSASQPWGTPVNLGPNVNSALGAETRPSLSWDGTTLYYGSTRPGGEGMADHYASREP